MPRAAVTSRTSPSTPQPRIKLWLEQDGAHVFCAGLCQILEAVAQHGSIKEAAASIGKSYRFVWAKIKAAEQSLGTSLVDAQVGGAGVRRSELSPGGKRMVDYYRTLQAELHAVVDRHMARRGR